jgi:hypothetical protein
MNFNAALAYYEDLMLDRYLDELDRRGEMANAVQDLGWANDWSEWPEIFKRCRELDHDVISVKKGECLHEDRCDICGYKYMVDSSD